MNRSLTSIVVLLVAVNTTAATARVPPRPNLGTLSARGLRVSGELYDLTTHHVLAAIHRSARLIPASLSKLYVALAALKHWGADHRFTTSVDLLETSPGDRRIPPEWTLVLVGGGDPALTYPTLARLAFATAALAPHGRFQPLILVPGFLGTIPCFPSDRCRARRTARHAYPAPLTDLESDYGSYGLLVTPAPHAHLFARLSLLPFPLPGVHLDDRIMTVRNGLPTSLRVRRRSGPRGTWIRVGGIVAAATPPQRIYVAAGHPLRLTGRIFRGLLQRAGVQLPPGLVVRPHPPWAARLLVRVHGESLARILHTMVAYSNNVIADLLTLDWARSTRGRPARTLRGAATQLARALFPLLRRHGARRPPLLLTGSGLSPGNRSSARELVALLRTGYDLPALFPTLLGALALPGQTPMRFIDDPSDPLWEHRVAIKTGTLTSPVAAVGFAGYARLGNGDWAAFAVLVNGTSLHPEVGVTTVLRATRRFLDPWLSS